MNFELENTFMPWLGKTSKMMEGFVKDLFYYNDINLTTKQWVVLKLLNEQGGIAQHELALVTGRDKASLTRLIHTMEKKQFVTRVASKKDKRINIIFSTNKGDRIYNNSVPIVFNAINNIQKGISELEISSTISTIKKIQNNIILNQEKLQ